MLERACSTAEPAAYALLHRFEVPLRSNRVLRPYFFRNEGHHLDTPQWWPLYLENLRKVPQSTRNHFDISLTRPRKRNSSLSKNRYSIPVQSLKLSEESEVVPRTTDHTRSFVVSSQNARRKSLRAAIDPEDLDLLEAHNVQRHEEYTPENETALLEERAGSSQSNSAFVKPGLRDVMNKPKPSDKDYDLAWKIFMNLKDQKFDAVHMFSFLAKSPHSRDLGRCMNVFTLIEIKTQSIYNTAVDVLLQSFQHREAINIAVDGSIRGFDLLPRLLAHFVKNLLWGSAAELWQRNQIGESDASRRLYGKRSDISGMILTEEELIRGCVSMIDLPNKIVVLAERLKQHDPVYAEQRSILQAICEQLTTIVISSEQIMRSITGKGMLAMLDLQDQLNVVDLHKTAIQTILGMRESGSKVQLALLILKNHRLRRPNESLPRSALGSLISICGNARYPPDVYEDILAEFRRSYDKPDEAAYQRIMTLCARQGKPEAVQRYMDEYIQDYGPPTSLDFLSPLIYAYASYGDAKNARHQFDRIHTEYSLICNTECWNMLLLAHSRSADPFSAFDVFEEMRQRGVSPDRYTYGTIIGLCALQGDTDATLLWIQRTQDIGIELTVPMLGALVDAHLYNGQIAEAEKVAEAVTASHPDDSHTRTWNSILRHYAYKADTQAILRTQQRMRSLNVRPDGMTYAALMAALVVLRRTKDAVKILRTLHLTQNLDADIFHYSILLNGFVREGKRDQAAVIYHEIQERFPNISVDARKSMLKMQSERGISAERFNMTTHRYMEFSQQHALEFLAQAVTEISPSDQVPSPSNPRKASLGAHRELLAQYFDVLLATMVRDGSYEQADRLLSHFESFSKSMSQGDQVAEASVKLLTIKMELAIHRQNWHMVEETWQELFIRVKRRSQSVEEIRKQRLERENQRVESSKTAFENTEVPLPQNLSSFPQIVPSPDITPLLDRPVLPAHRFALNRAVSTYMDAMDLQLQHDDIVKLVEEDFPNAGFELDGKNWNKFVQVLAKSPNFKHRLHAFRVFEEKMLSLAPRWSLLRRGRWTEDDAAVETTQGGLTKIRNKQKMNPTLPYPTYMTMIYLATILFKADRKMALGDGKELEDLEKYARSTLRRVQATPYLRDRFQGFLLRGRDVVGDPDKRPRSNVAHQRQESVSGVLGSKSPLDNIAPEHMAEIENLIAPRDDIRSLLRGKDLSDISNWSASDLRVAEQVTGQIGRSPEVLPLKGRLEEREEYWQRLKKEEKIKLNMIHAIRKDARRRHLVADPYRGDPPLAMLDKQREIQTLPKQNYKDSAWVFRKGRNLRIFHRTRPKPTSRAPSHWRMPHRGERDTTILKQKITPRMVKQHPLIMKTYVSARVGREFTKNKAVRAARTRNRRIRRNIT